MTRYIFAAFGVVVAGAAGAQTPSPSQPATTAQRNDQSITVSGCLKPWTGTGSSAPSTTASPSTTPAATGGSGSAYVLTNIERKDSAATSTSPRGEAGTATGATTGTASAMGQSQSREEYLLQADSSVDLSKHVNHQVEVTGRSSMGSSSSSRTGATGTSGTTGTAGTTGATGTTGTTGTAGTTATTGMTGQDAHKSAPATLTVTSLKMISATCK